MQILYILGTGYCGSTALEMTLGANNKVINLGEVDRILYINDKHELNKIFNEERKSDKNNFCSCGNIMSECEYWSGFFSLLEKNIDKSFLKKYSLHLEYFESIYPNHIMVDSSKNLSTLTQLKSLIDTKIINILLLVKDIRNWTTSVQKKHGGNAFKRYIRWYIEHKKFLKFLNDKEYILLGYEEFALFPEICLTMLCEKLKISYDNKMLIPSNNHSHSIFSNRMRYDSSKKSQIFYDYRWFKNNSLNLASLLMPFAMKMNKELVYSNNIIENMFGYKETK